MIWLIRLLEPDRLPREQLVRVKASGAGPVTLRLLHFPSEDAPELRRTALRGWEEPAPPNCTELGLIHVGPADQAALLRLDLSHDANARVRKADHRTAGATHAADQLRLKLDGQIELMVGAEIEREVLLRPGSRRTDPGGGVGLDGIIARAAARSLAMVRSGVQGINLTSLVSLLLAIALLGTLWGRPPAGPAAEPAAPSPAEVDTPEMTPASEP